ncbi:MAG: response regulator [Deltaproteobacteria bacterium]|nr:response regulator [Deltaproteobacteria bacterium]
MTADKAILLIDDSDDTLEILSAKLAHHGYAVETAADGETGLAMIRERRPSIVFCDIMLPRMDGWAVLAAVKSDPDIVDIPVVLMTAYTTIQFQGERAQALDYGAAEYLRKPFELGEMIELVKRLAG